jgi:hypothetical protein
METITERIANLETAIFLLECTDHWTTADYRRYSELNEELRRLKAQA